MFAAVIMKKSLFFVDKELLKDLFEKLIYEWTVLAIDVKKLLIEVFEILILSLINFSSFLINDGRARQIAHTVTSMHAMCVQRGFCMHKIACT